MKKNIKIITYLISPLFVTFLLFIRKFVKVRLCYLPSHRIGELAGEVASYLCKSKNLKKNCLDIFFLTDKVSNKYFVNFLKKKITIYPNYIFLPFYEFLNFISYLIPIFKQFILKNDYKDKNLKLSKCNNFPKFTQSEIKKGDKLLEKIGIKSKDKIVCLITRDKLYLKKNFPKINSYEHNFRNCDINNYIKSIKFLIKNKYKVLRMGVDYSNKLNYSNKNFIDYGKKYRNSFLDIYLAYKCDLVITSVTGWDIIPSFFFKKPTIWTNLVPYNACLPYNSKSMFLPKKYYNSKLNKYLSLKEISRLKGDPFKTSSYKKNHIKLIENNSNEIYQATKEMYLFLKKPKINLNKLQTKFWKYFNLFFNHNNQIFNKKKKPKGFFSYSFLRKNLYLFND